MTPRAEMDFARIEAYLAERFYPANAARFIDRLVAACLKIGLVPAQGTVRNDLGAGVRVKGFERKVAIHFVATVDQVVILGVEYGGHQPGYLVEDVATQ